ncbi:glycosyltransferase [Clostridium tyrobutyricum]|uniref:glycosyltransferase n=1 Tax=Clostridium tyrobutyricum TaxID=1519 RepID=UPI0018AB2775|nr:glycosyltransferase [Clostridium tyrobutyricum]MBR9647294.1 glycosyltransferase [Clostridium tyrobutyricum]
MNIIFISAELPYPDNSGGRIYTWERLKQLKKNGNNICLYTLVEENEFINLNVLNTVCVETNVYKREKSYIKAVLNINKPYSVISRFINKMYYDIKEKINHDNVELIIIDIPEMLMNCPFDNDICKVVTQHNIEYETFRSISENSNDIFKKIAYYFEYIKMKRFEERYYNNNLIQGCTFISNIEFKQFMSKFPNIDSVCVPQGYDVENSITSNTEFINKNIRNNIIFTGKMDYEPNIQAVKWFCKDILPLIKKEINDVKFYIVGKNPTNEVKGLANDSVIVTGKVASIKEYFNKTNLCVIPLKSGGGVKIKLFEALGNGKIVVTTSKGIEGTKFRNNKHILIKNGANEFAKACVDALNYPEKYCKIINNSLNLIKDNYSWNAIGECYNKFLNDLK